MKQNKSDSKSYIERWENYQSLNCSSSINSKSDGDEKLSVAEESIKKFRSKLGILQHKIDDASEGNGFGFSSSSTFGFRNSKTKTNDNYTINSLDSQNSFSYNGRDKKSKQRRKSNESKRSKRRYRSMDVVFVCVIFFILVVFIQFWTHSIINTKMLSTNKTYEHQSLQAQQTNIHEEAETDVKIENYNLRQKKSVMKEKSTSSNIQNHEGVESVQQNKAGKNNPTGGQPPLLIETNQEVDGKPDNNENESMSRKNGNDLKTMNEQFDEDAAISITGNLNQEELLKLSASNGNMISRHALKPQQYVQPDPQLQIPVNLDQKLANIDVMNKGKLPAEGNITPLFWHILKSGGTTVKDYYGTCHGFVEATESGVLSGHDQDSSLQIIQLSPEGGIRYVNVDTTTAPGIERAIQFDLINSNVADIIFSPLLHEASDMYTTDHKAQMFGLFRHPVERAVSLYHYLKKATWEPTFSEKIKDIRSIEDYAISIFAEDNWMVRFLTNKMTEMVTRKDLLVAKEILRRKCIVGIMIDVEGSVKRFNEYFGWNNNVGKASEEGKSQMTESKEECAKQFLHGGSNKNKHELVEEGGPGWKILRANNLLDLELYEYVLQLYEEQGQQIFSS